MVIPNKLLLKLRKWKMCVNLHDLLSKVRSAFTQVMVT